MSFIISCPSWVDNREFVCPQQEKLANELKEFTKNTFYDILLIVGEDNVRISAHRIVLCESSNYFKKTISGGPKNSNWNWLQIKEVSADTMKLILKFMYSGKIEMNCNKTKQILDAADFLQMTTLQHACYDFIESHLDMDKYVGIALFAQKLQYKNSKIESPVSTYSNVEKACMDFLQFKPDKLLQILKAATNDLMESFVSGLIAWMNFNVEVNAKTMQNILSQVRYRHLSLKYLYEKETVLCKNPYCIPILRRWMKWRQKAEELGSKENKRLVILDCILFRLQVFDRERKIWQYEGIKVLKEEVYFYSAIFINQILFLVGGMIDGRDTNRVQYFERSSWTWQDLPPMKYARCFCGVAELDGELYVVGGSANGKWLRSVEKYNFISGKWQDCAPLNSPLPFGWESITVVNKLIYIIFDCIECYDPVKNIWIRKKSLNSSQSCSGIDAINGKLYCVGRVLQNTSLKRYCPIKNIWEEEMPFNSYVDHAQCRGWNRVAVIMTMSKHKFKLTEFDPFEEKCYPLPSLLPHSTTCQLLTM